MDIKLQEIANQAAGFYFLTYDNSAVATQPTTSRLRLVFVNLPKGPVNNLIYVQARDYAGFKKLFGDIDRRDERNGNFSVRTCLWALERGPILVCNIRSFDDTKDLAGLIGLSTKMDVTNKPAVKVPYTSLFNTERLWWNDPSQLLNNANSNQFNFGNVGSSDISVYVKKSTAKGYDVPLKTWYANLNRELPLYVNPSDYVSDTMVDVYVFKTNFGDNLANVANENYGHLFTEFGMKPYIEQNGSYIDSLELLAQTSDSQYVGKYMGSLIHGIVDQSNNPMNIELILNSATNTTGLVAKFDEVSAEEIGDWEGEFDVDGAPIYLSDKSKKPYAIDLVGHSIVHLDADNNISALPVNVNNVLSYSKATKSGTVDVNIAENSVKLTDVYNADRIDITAFISNAVQKQTNKFYVLDAVSLLYGDRVVGVDGNLKRVTKSTVIGTKTIVEGLGKAELPLQADGTIYPKNTSNIYIYPIAGDGVVTTEWVHQPNTPVQFDVDGNPLSAETGLKYDVTLSPAQLAEYKSTYGTVYNVLECECEDKVHVGDVTELKLTPANLMTITLDDSTTLSVLKTSVSKINPIFSGNSHYLKGIVLNSYKARKDQFTNGTSTQQNTVLDIMNAPNIVKGLKSVKEYRPRYIVDAFKTFIEPSYKYQYSSLAFEMSERSTVFVRAIINEAFVEDMKNSKNPYFKNSQTGIFDAAYIETGGNRSMISTNIYEKPKEGDKYSFYFGPGVRVNHYGQSIIAPVAGLVSNAFLAKYTNALPYTIVANNSGVITGNGVSGVEIEFDQDDRAPLERVGYNAIIKEVGKGLLIYGNNTGQYRLKTSFSKIHVSELIAFIQEQMLAVMKDYAFEYNDYQHRLEVKKRADGIMNPILDNGGVIYFENVCNETNNTMEIIENDMAVIDTIIIAGHGSEKWVHRTFLEKAGNITGFELI